MKRRFFVAAGAGVAAAAVLPRLPSNGNSLAMDLGLMEPAFASTSAASVTSRDSILWAATRAYQRMVCRAEGTYIPGKSEMNPYQVIYTYDKFTDFSDHPRRSHPIPGRAGWSSDAAGAYQFLSTTWDRTVKNNDFWYEGDSFSPRNQDLGFLYLHRDTGAHREIRDGCRTFGGKTFVSSSLWTKAVKRDSREWASLPGKDIGAATGQHTKGENTLWSWFSWELNKEQGLLGPTVFPLEGFTSGSPPSSNYGWRWHPVRGGRRFHSGVDYPTPTGVKVRAPEAGRVVANQELSGGGNTVLFRPALDPFKVMRVMHLSQFLVPEGSWVEAGEPIALTGDTGTSTTGPHAHIEIWQGVSPGSIDVREGAPVEPKPYLSLGNYYE